MSGDILSRIQILLDANTANFEQNLQNAQRTSVSTFDKIKSSAKVMGTAVAAGAASATVALAAMAWETANQAVELEKFALRANTTTQDFQKMAVGAQAYGIEQEKLSDMMKDFNEKLGELTTIGAGGGVDFFEQIAVKTEGSAAAAEKLILKMQKLSGPEALQLYVDKLEEAGVTQQQMSFYLESMASDMTDLIPLLINGGEGMQLYSDAAERAGIVMNDETIAQAKILKEQMYLLDLQLQGAKNQLMQAVIPAFVDIAQAFFGGSEQGIQFTGVAEGIAKALKIVASIAIGAVTAIQLVGKALGGMAAVGGALWNELDWYEMNPIGLVKAAYEARAEISALTNEMKADMHSTIIGAAERLDGMWSGTSSGTAAQMAALRSVEKTTGGVNAGLGTLVEKQDKAEKSAKKATKANSELNKALRDQERALEQAKRLVYEYGDELLRIEEDLRKDLEEIQGATLKAEAKDRYSALAKAQAASRKQLYVAELENELYEHRKTEEEKLADELRINKLRLDAQRGLNKNELELRKKALEDKYRLELSQIEEEKRARVNSASAAWGGTFADMTGQGEDHALSQQRFSRIDESQELFDAQMALADTAEEREAIWEAHHNRMQFIEQEYFRSRANMQLQWGMSYVQGAAGVMAQVFGENSKAYQAMFAVQKAMAIAQVMMNAPATFSAVMTSASAIPVVGPFIAPGLAAGAVALQMAQAAMIGSVSFQPTGMAHDGIDRIPEEGSWWLDKGERVLKEQTSSKLDSTLDEIRRNNREPAYDMPSVQQPIYNIQALDGKSVERVLKKHSRHVAGSMKGYARNFGRYK
ncbi:MULTISPECIES: hypothetical protein [Acinetobacter]|uniref:Phage tail tape measure protein n=1 Tax=Acinetobacter piscicola TaxID=2006115 RepID=A0A7S6VYT0_9GAMM|nr:MULTISPECIES: hypothetical protein [Acinetobacter]QOW47237.1 hypothetical protein G0028_15880 [Acinetobacter piscicola]